MKILLLVLLFVSCQKGFNSNVLKAPIEKLEKFNDEKEVNFYTLENGLKVYLTSTNDLKKSMVALSVNVGSGFDPKGQEGMAHFLEHMLFLGTEKYPKVGEYQSFFNNHQGDFNAYTATEQTNYHFDIPHEHLEKGIDRFSQFFISPTFDKEYVKREKFAVNSEHQKNLLNDGRRLYRMKQFMLPEDHSVRSFSTGNSQTLKKITRKDVMDFYQKYYSANMMNLVIYSSLPISEQKKLVSQYFAKIPNRNLKEPVLPPVNSNGKAQVVHIKSKSKMQKMILDFDVPLQNEKYWKTKPLYIIGHLIGHESEGSLLSLLKKENLAFGLGAGSNESSFQNSFSISISLTEKGLKHTDRIIGLTFAFIEILKQKGLQDFIFDELDIMQRLEYVYGNKHVSLSEVSSLADYLFKFPYKDIQKRATLLYKKAGEEYKLFLKALKPENLTVYIQHPDAHANKKEPFYGIDYSIKQASNEQLKLWSSTTDSKLSLTGKNQYIPEDLDLKLDETSKYPKLVLDGERGSFYFQQNKELLYPNAMITLRLLTHKKYINPHDQILTTLYISALADTLNEWQYMAETAGLKLGVSNFSRGIEISLSGYSDKILVLMKDLISKLKIIEMSDEKFNIYIDEINKGFHNFELQPAYHQAGYWLKHIIRKNSFSHQELKVALKKIKPSQVFKFKDELYKQFKIEGLAFGNLHSKDLEKILAQTHEMLSAKPLEEENVILDEDIMFNEGLEKFTFPSQGNNNAWYGHFQFGPREIQMNSYLRLLSAIIDSEFYSEMRTNQQLGYIVHSGYNYMSKSYGYDFLIQSSRFSTKQLREKAIGWMKKNIPTLLQSVPDEEFQKLKQTIHDQILIPERSMNEKMIWLITQAYVLNGDFEYKNKFAQAILDVKKEQFTQEIMNRLIKEPVEISVEVGTGLKQSTNIQVLKSKLPTFK